MYILLSGKQGVGKSTIAECLRKYYSYRGVACLTYDFMTPVQEAHDAVIIALSRYGIAVPKEGSYDKSIYQSMYNWIGDRLPAFATTNYYSAIAKWDELKLFYIVVIDNATTPEHLKSFGSSFKVYLDCDEEIRKGRISSSHANDTDYILGDEHPLVAGFNDCAVSDIFDHVVDTSNLTPEAITLQIGDAVHKKLFVDGWNHIP